MRGKASTLKTSRRFPGITPAYAGKSEFPPAFTNVSRDHPRLCGEKPLIGVRCFSPLGSPPPMRGKEIVLFCTLPAMRITPAYAGKSIDICIM